MVAQFGESSNSAQQHRLVSYIQDHLITLNTHLDSETFDRVLQIIHQRVLHTFHDAITADIEKKRMPPAFRQWDELLLMVNECFHEPEQSDDTMDKIRKKLRLHGSETESLIHQYELDRMKEANEIETSDLGSITIRALFVDDKLHLDILNGRNLKAMDSAGSSDPYLKIRIMPEDKFPDAEIHKTRTHKNTLFPLFDESFTSTVAPDLQSSSDCYVVFTLKDKDLIGKNELMGEAFLSFTQICRGDTTSAIQDLEQIHLNLSKPSNKDSEYLQILDGRSWDKKAKDYAKKEKKKMNWK